MSRTLLLALSLFVLPAAAFDFKQWADKNFDKMVKQAEKEKVEELANARDPQTRVKAAEWMGGRREPYLVAALAMALSDPDAKVRYAVANSLWRTGEAAAPAKPELLKALDDPDVNVVARAAGALQIIGMKEAELVAPRRRVFNSPEATESSRFLVARNLAGHEPAPKLLEAMLVYLERASTTKGGGDNVKIAEEAMERFVKRVKDPGLAAPLMNAARTARGGQPVIIRTLGFVEPKPEGFVSFVLEFIDSRDPNIRHAAVYALRDARKEKDVALWAPRVGLLTADPDRSVKMEALWVLGYAGGLAASQAERVVAALGDPDKDVRERAAHTIGAMGDPKQAVAAANKARAGEVGRPALTAAMEKDPAEDVRKEAKRALAVLGGAGGAPAKEAKAVARKEAGPAEASGMAVLRDRKVSFQPTSFYRALSKQDIELVRAFLDAGMGINDSVGVDGPPIRVLFFNAEACHPRERPTRPETKAVAKLLLDRGADPNVADRNGTTALMEASSHGCDREVTRMLIKAGANVNAKNKMGLTPFEMGLLYAHDGLEEILAAGYRLPPDKAKGYAEGYKGKADVQEMIRKASR